MNNFWCSDNLNPVTGERLSCDICVKGNCQSSFETLVCPNTDNLLKKMGEAVSGGYAKFKSLPTAEKQKILKKRSHQHFKKHIEEKKVHMNRQVDPRYNPPKK